MAPFFYRISLNRPNTPRTQAGLGFFIGFETDTVRIFRVRVVLGDFSFGVQF